MPCSDCTGNILDRHREGRGVTRATRVTGLAYIHEQLQLSGAMPKRTNLCSRIIDLHFGVNGLLNYFDSNSLCIEQFRTNTPTQLHIYQLVVDLHVVLVSNVCSI